MPELPEVETLRRSLLPLLGKRIEAVHVWERRLRRPIGADFEPRVVGAVVDAIERRGKYLLFRLSNGTWILGHLGMTGTLLLQPRGTPRRAHDHVRFDLSADLQLTFNDPRRFGALRAGDLADHLEIQRLGRDPLDEDFRADELFAMTRGRRKPIKNLLMDQPVLAGIGNIYANEALFRAGIRPGRQAARLTRVEAARLFTSVRECLEEAIDLGGSSISDYRNGEGRPGYFQLRLQVYDRHGSPCPICATIIQRRVQAGRSSFYCRRCQR